MKLPMTNRKAVDPFKCIWYQQASSKITYYVMFYVFVQVCSTCSKSSVFYVMNIKKHNFSLVYDHYSFTIHWWCSSHSIKYFFFNSLLSIIPTVHWNWNISPLYKRTKFLLRFINIFVHKNVIFSKHLGKFWRK